MSGNIVVYSQAGCGRCVFAKNKLKDLGLEFEEKRMDLNPDARQEAIELGAQGAPFIISPTGEGRSGFDSSWLESFVPN